MTGEEFRAIYAAQGERLLRIAVAVSSTVEAEDAVAETFARCWRRWRRGAPDDPAAYLRRALLNELIRDGRRRSRQVPTESDPPETAATTEVSGPAS